MTILFISMTFRNCVNCSSGGGDLVLSILERADPKRFGSERWLVICGEKEGLCKSDADWKPHPTFTARFGAVTGRLGLSGSVIRIPNTFSQLGLSEGI